jgi:hypothetical protein
VKFLNYRIHELERLLSDAERLEATGERKLADRVNGSFAERFEVLVVTPNISGRLLIALRISADDGSQDVDCGRD